MIQDFYSAPPDYSHYIKKIQEIKNCFPFLKVFTIGQSRLGRKIYAIGIGQKSSSVLFAGATHAQEWLTCTLLVRYLEHLSLAFSKNTPICGSYITKSLLQRGVVFVPMVNPDGVMIALEGAKSAGEFASSVQNMQQKSKRSWQANAAGVDLNHNFDAGWKELHIIEQQNGITEPCSRQYGGPFPFSEPETRALSALLKGRNIKRVYAFHSQGEEIYSDYENKAPAQSKYIANLLSEVSGYLLVKNDGLASHGGLKDYFIDRFERPAFTIEIGKGENPLPVSDLEDIYSKVLEMLVVATVL